MEIQAKYGHSELEMLMYIINNLKGYDLNQNPFLFCINKFTQ